MKPSIDNTISEVRNVKDRNMNSNANNFIYWFNESSYSDTQITDQNVRGEGNIHPYIQILPTRVGHVRQLIQGEEQYYSRLSVSSVREETNNMDYAQELNSLPIDKPIFLDRGSVPIRDVW